MLYDTIYSKEFKKSLEKKEEMTLKKILIRLFIIIISLVIITCVSVLSLNNFRSSLPLIYNNDDYHFEIPVPSGVVYKSGGGTCGFSYDYLRTQKTIDKFYEKILVDAYDNYPSCGENGDYKIFYIKQRDIHILIPIKYSIRNHRIIFNRLSLCFPMDATDEELSKYIEDCKH